MKTIIGRIIVLTVNITVLMFVNYLSGMDAAIILAASLIITNQIFPSYPTE